MELEREQVVQTTVSVGVVLVMLGVFYVIGNMFNDGGIGPDGGMYLLGSIVLFVVLMMAAGVYLAFTISESAAEDTVEGFE